MHPIGIHIIALRFVLKFNSDVNTLNGAMCARMTETTKDVLESGHVNFVKYVRSPCRCLDLKSELIFHE
jgi:hypothetical protein